jgi:hypothetical protein
MDKHARYLKYYKPNEFYWGIGIENETYFQFTKKIQREVNFIYKNHKPERYSVDYFAGLDPEYKQLLKSLFSPTQNFYEIPVYINSHSFQKTDISGTHETTYEHVPKPNPRFKGKTLHDYLCEKEPGIFKDKYKINYLYDGDSIEFMTQNFYNTTVRKTIDELIKEKALFLKAINRVFKKHAIYKNYGDIIYPERNEPFVTFLSNLNNLATFNNGTYHINLTMPTQLDSMQKPENPAEFVSKHKAAIRYIQFLEPLIISLYGTRDPFSEVSHKFSKASQRCAASRYIGLGTFDTDTMMVGKNLQIPVAELEVNKHPFWWYKVFHATSNYIPQEKIGLDVNFNKHGAHGIELRFFDWFPEAKLENLMETLVHVLDFSCFYGLPFNPIHSPLWNQIVVKCLQNGEATQLNDEECSLYETVFDLQPTRSRFIRDIYELIELRVRKRRGVCARLMIGSKSIFHNPCFS